MTGKWHFITIAHDLNYVIEGTLSIISDYHFYFVATFVTEQKLVVLKIHPRN